jgi:hypothetical protein
VVSLSVITLARADYVERMMSRWWQWTLDPLPKLAVIPVRLFLSLLPET